MNLKHSVRQSLLDTPLFNFIQSVRRAKHLKDWKINGYPVPAPHAAKQSIVLKAAKESLARCFIETGTYDGDMTYAVKDHFERVHTIEIFEPLYLEAKKRFEKFSNISVELGDSADILPKLLKEINLTCLFWLDGHFSGVLEGRDTGGSDRDVPILEEIRCIANHQVKNHTILIDDARCFVGTHGYPELKVLESQIKELLPNHSLTIEHDIMSLKPNT